MWFIKQIRWDDAMDLIKKSPNAFILLTVIAQRARREDSPVMWLKKWQCFVGDYDNYWMTRQQYRTALDNLFKWQIINQQTTNKWTIVSLLSKAIYDINESDDQPTDNQQTTNKQPLTRKKERKKEEKEIYNTEFEKFYKLYPKHTDRKDASLKFEIKAKQDWVEKIMQGLASWNAKWQNEATEMNFIPSPTVWLNKERYNDEIFQKHPTSWMTMEERYKILNITYENSI